MKRIVGLAAVLAFLAPLVAGQDLGARRPAPAKGDASKAAPSQAVLPERYRRWLDEEVVYIIAKREREVFLQLQTDRERDIFIEAFWK
ncbi:MAG TPA: hypothetical protein PLP83_05775, partial [Candidatus Aminicenantes bacterium]|nr:hypothetical protein [Candidatus Aminicenantes bacterium]